jgi:cell fate regulator YaaT (PSP1 superfamily)
MYNIDLSFIKNSELNSIISNLDTTYNNLFRKKILDDIAKLQIDNTPCSECGIDLSNDTKIDDRKIIEANSKGLVGKHFCHTNGNDLELNVKDLILIRLAEGTEVAIITETEEIAKYKRQRLGLNGEELPKILRKLNEEDLKHYQSNLDDEKSAKDFFMQSIANHKLEMKLVDIHYQFDRKKLYFYYTADGRVDFRQLVKELATEFKTRIELRQIGVRDEAKMVGGMGSCGREYCCTSFISSFKKVTTQIAHDQNLTSFLTKHSGPCGKLKCCLSFEVKS